MATSSNDLARILNFNQTDSAQLTDALDDFFGERDSEDGSLSSEGEFKSFKVCLVLLISLLQPLQLS